MGFYAKMPRLERKLYEKSNSAALKPLNQRRSVQMEIQILLAKLVTRLAKDRRSLTTIFVLVAIVVTTVLAFFEGFDHNFKDWVDYLSWIAGTVTTTGFTAMPSTFWGRLWDAILKIPLFVLSLGVMGMFLVWWIESATATRRGMSTFKGTGHVLVIGWTPVTTKWVKKYQGHQTIVVVDESLEFLPDGVDFFVRGRASQDDVLIRAGVQRAAIVLIDLVDDGLTGLTGASVRRLNPNARVTVVALEVENIDRLEATNTKVICAVKFAAEAIVAELRGRSTMVFGSGPVVSYLRILLQNWSDTAKTALVFSEGNPAIDADLIQALVNNFEVAVIVPENDEHGWLAIYSVRALTVMTEIVAILAQEENRPHFDRCGQIDGADLIVCPTTLVTQ